MKYRNAAEVLPLQLLQELQRYAAGQLLYIPAGQRREWGAGTGANRFYARRNTEIRGKYFGGKMALPALCEEYCLSEEAVRTILYKKGEGDMKDSGAIDYSGYFWQNDLVRLRRPRAEEWEVSLPGMYNSARRFFTQGEQELPWDERSWQESWASYVKANQAGDTWVLFTVETLEGRDVGGGNLHGIDERNGTFGFCINTEEERYTVAAARLMLDYAFNERRLHKCHNYALEGDTRAIAEYEALGFKKEGVLRGQVFHRGKYWDEHHYGLLAEEFNAAS